MCKDGSFIPIDPRCVYSFIETKLNHYGGRIPECPAGFRFTGRMLDSYPAGSWILLPNGKPCQVSESLEHALFTGWRFELEKIEPKYRYICDERERFLVFGDWYKVNQVNGFLMWDKQSPSTYKDLPFRREEIK